MDESTLGKSRASVLFLSSIRYRYRYITDSLSAFHLKISSTKNYHLALHARWKNFHRSQRRHGFFSENSLAWRPSAKHFGRRHSFIQRTLRNDIPLFWAESCRRMSPLRWTTRRKVPVTSQYLTTLSAGKMIHRRRQTNEREYGSLVECHWQG